jgi:uncharacterized membrane protein YeaQ/YmgE (transglycosylase-associated protein family)
MNIVIWMIVGGLIGWAVSMVWHDPEGMLMNVVVGIVGALIGGWLLVPTVAAGTMHSGDFSLVGLAVSLLGAVTVLAVVNLVRLGSLR